MRMVAGSRPLLIIAWEWHDICLALLCGYSGALEYPTTNSYGPISGSFLLLLMHACYWIIDSKEIARKTDPAMLMRHATNIKPSTFALSWPFMSLKLILQHCHLDNESNYSNQHNGLKDLDITTLFCSTHLSSVPFFFSFIHPYLHFPGMQCYLLSIPFIIMPSTSAFPTQLSYYWA